MPLRLRINNLNKNRKINKKEIEKAALRVLWDFNKKSAFINITFINDNRIKSLNKKYMRRNYSTDVLSFPLKEKREIVGDIYISSDMANRNAKRFNTSFRKEIILYTIHGVLHILGFSDKTEREKKRIRKLEERFLINYAKKA